MSIFIVKSLKTTLKSPLTTTATSVVLRSFTDSKGNNLALANFGEWGVIVIKQASTIEMIKFDAISIAGDGTATLTVATNGRNLDPTTPYAGSSTGNAFSSGAAVIVTNDPLTVSQFVNKKNAETITGVHTYDADNPPRFDAHPTYGAGTDQYFTDKEYVDGVALAGAADATTTAKGVAEEATEAEIDADTAAGSAARLFVNPSTLATSKYGTQLPSADEKDALAGAAVAPSSSNPLLTENDDSGNYRMPAGMVVPYAGASAPTGWLLCDDSDVSLTTYEGLYDVIGTTFGAVSGGGTFTASGATLTQNSHGYSNGDVLILTTSNTLPAGLSTATKYYVVNKTDNTFELSATPGGASITTTDGGTGTHTSNPDFALPDMRGNFPLGKDNMGGSARNRVTHTNADTVGAEEGAETHTLVAGEMPAHTHTLTFLTSSSGGSGPAPGTTSATNDPRATSSAGDGDPHENMSPYMTFNYIIKV